MMFSVIIPAYNAELFITKAIQSVLNQTLSDFEIIVVDDGSTDQTYAQITSIQDARIRCIRQQNSGVSAARNTGIMQARGEYICFLDADDLWKPRHLAVLSMLIHKYPECGMFLTGYEIVLVDGRVIPKSQNLLKKVNDSDFSSSNGYDLLLRYGYFFNTNSICCNKAAFSEVGLFAVGVKNGEDDDMWWRLFARYNIAVAKEITTVYMRENCGATAQRLNFLDWVFLRHADEILNDSGVSQERKESLKILLERRKMSQIRKLILSGEKKAAFRLFRTLELQKHSYQKVLVTYTAFFIPSGVIKWIINRRDRGYYIQ